MNIFVKRACNYFKVLYNKYGTLSKTKAEELLKEGYTEIHSDGTFIKSDVIVDKNGIEIEGHYIDNG